MKLNQKGFTLIEGLLVIIALTLIVGVGVYVLNSSKKTTPTAKSTDQASTSTDNYYTFKQLGVKIPKSDALKNVIFTEDLDKASLNGIHNNIVIYNTASLIDKYTTCVKNNPGQFVDPTAAQLLADANKFGGAIISQEGDFNRDQAAVAASTMKLIKQFNSFYLFYSGDDISVCSKPDGTPDQDLNNSLSHLRDIVVPAFKHAQELEPNN